MWENKGIGVEATAVGVDHHNCRFGKWYYQRQGNDFFSHLPAYHRLESSHKVIDSISEMVIEKHQS